MRLATERMRSGDPTEVPPNFWTTSRLGVTGAVPWPRACRLARLVLDLVGVPAPVPHAPTMVPFGRVADIERRDRARAVVREREINVDSLAERRFGGDAVQIRDRIGLDAEVTGDVL